MVADPDQSSPENRPGEDQYQVSLSVPWIVWNVPSAQDAINIAVSEVGKRVQRASKKQVEECEISIQGLSDSQGQQTSEAVLVVANTALVGLLLTCRVQARSHDDAKAAARRDLGRELEEIPLVPIDVSPVSRNEIESRDASSCSGNGV